MINTKYNCIVLFSGGVDSLAALLWARQKYSDVLALYCDVGQRYAKKEIKAVEKICQILNQPYIIENRLCLSELELPKERNSVIPYRNTFFILFASTYTPETGGTVILQNLVQGEDSTFDRREEFNIQIQKFLPFADKRKINIIAPYANFTKSEIIKKIINMKEYTPEILQNTIGCYSETEENCGECNSCFRAYVALKYNNQNEIIKKRFVKDPSNWSGAKEYVLKMKVGLYGEERTKETLTVFNNLSKKCRVIAIDIDGVISFEGTQPSTEKGWNEYFKNLKPIQKTIDKINLLYNQGNAIVLYTSRRESDITVTEEWLKNHKVQYHRLVTGKFLADIYIDDRSKELSEL